MKPNEQNLERLVKKLLKQQSVSATELLAHWEGLGARGDRVVVQTLNKQNGWEQFVLWSESEPHIRKKLEQVSDRAGISEAGVLYLKSAGFTGGEEDTPRSRALWILQTVRNEDGSDWDQAIRLMLQDEDFFESTLALLELEGSALTASFLTKLLEENPGREKDQAIRKALYRLRQKGWEAPQWEKPIVTVEPTRHEIFLLAENRLPLWQPFFYFRGNGPRGDWFFVEITEGKNFEIIQQRRDIRMNQKTMQRVADDYAAEFHKGTGVNMSFHALPPEHARFFVMSSFEFLQGAEDFRKYMGEATAQNPFSEWTPRTNLYQQDAALLLNHEYFQLWLAEEEFLDQVIQRLVQIEEGPIILPEQQRLQQKAEAVHEASGEYFSAVKRPVWALALQKAAYFLKDKEPEIAAMAFGFSRMLDPFAVHLIERSLEIRKAQIERKEKEEKRTSLIMSPQEFQRSMKKP
ncbi:hypothetical protein L0156_30430 [bacterium]|nr:hypothetical protein [bacterium]